MYCNDWSNLPDHILIAIFSSLTKAECVKAALVCQNWNAVFTSPYLWTSFKFWFYTPRQTRYIKCIDHFGKFLKTVYIELDQSVESNRKSACEVLKKLAQQEERRLKKLNIVFAGENPYFYAGLEFVDALSVLFGPLPSSCNRINQLIEIDLSSLTVSYSDDLFNTLSENNTGLEVLNIQNHVLVCKVSPFCILKLVQRCRRLRELYLFSCSLSEDILLAFTEDDRVPLQHLSIVCRREEKYAKDLGSEAWQAVITSLPALRVALKFDHTCPLHKVSEVMKPEVPIKELRLETFTYINDEIRQAASYYSKTLEKLVVQTPMSRNFPDFNTALVELVEACPNLRSLHVFCLLREDTIEKIFKLRPILKELKTYTMNSESKAHPWIAGNDC